MPEGDQVVNIVVIFGADDDIHHLVKDGALFHRRFGCCSLDVALDLLRDFVQAVHIKDLLADFVLIFLDVLIGINLLGE